MDAKLEGVRPRGNSIEIDFYYQGIRCRETLRIHPTKSALKEVHRKREAILHDIAMGKFNYLDHFPDSAKARKFGQIIQKTINDALDNYLTIKHHTCAASTWRDYRSAVEYHLKPQFGELFLNELTTTDINLWISTLTDISNKRINNILVPLRGVFDDAYHDGLININPLSRIKNLSVTQEEPNPCTPDEIKLILESSPGQIKNLFQFAFWTGLRTSELIALEWGDMDWKKNIARIQRASVRKVTKETKTRSGQRDIKLLPLALEALESQKSYTLKQAGRVFYNPRTNNPWETDSQIRRTAWIPALKRAGVHYRNPYQTRHTYASMLLTAGENPMWVAQQMGHKDWGMIRKRYGRWLQGMDSNAGNKITEFWSQTSRKDATSV